LSVPIRFGFFGGLISLGGFARFSDDGMNDS
jgi:hypothetical protein